MTRKLWIFGIVGIVGVSAAIAGVTNMRTASACDDNAKSAAVSQSCCARGTKTASVDAKKVNDSIVKSAVVAPGASPILNVAAFGAMLAGGTEVNSDCNWCASATMSAANCSANMSASECAAKMSAGECATATRMSSSECAAHANAQSASATVASSEHGCSGASRAAVASQGSHHAAMMAGGSGCCGAKSASAAASEEKCAENKSASLKGVVDEMPYRVSKRVTLAGSYACSHCNLEKTEACAPMLKTADGKVYPLLETARASELKNVEGKNIEVSGTVKKVDGIKFLDVKSYRVM